MKRFLPYITAAALALAPATATAEYSPDRFYAGPSSSGGSSSKSAGFRIFVHGIAGYDVLNLAGAGGTASFGGLVYGGGIEPHFSWGNIGLGTHVAFIRGDLTNGANTALRKETMSSNDIQLTLRLRSGMLLLGAGPAIRYLTLTSVNGSQTTITKYGAYGLRVEAGIRFVIGQYFSIAPMGQYETLWASPNDGTGAKRINSYTPLINIGFSW